MLKCARSFGANDWQIFRTIAVPGSIPFIITGLRLGMGRALIGVVVGELYAATAGVGYLITVAGATFQTDKVFVGVMIICFSGLAHDGALAQARVALRALAPARRQVAARASRLTTKRRPAEVGGPALCCVNGNLSGQPSRCLASCAGSGGCAHG